MKAFRHMMIAMAAIGQPAAARGLEKAAVSPILPIPAVMSSVTTDWRMEQEDPQPRCEALRSRSRIE